MQAADVMQAAKPVATAAAYPTMTLQAPGNIATIVNAAATQPATLEPRDVVAGNLAEMKITTKKTKKTKTTKTTHTTTTTRGNSTNAAYTMAVNPWRVAGVALGAAVLADQFNR